MQAKFFRRLDSFLHTSSSHKEAYAKKIQKVL